MTQGRVVSNYIRDSLRRYFEPLRWPGFYAVVGIACIVAEWGFGIGTPGLFYLGALLCLPCLWSARRHG